MVEECSQAYFIEKLFPPFRLILRATAELSTIHTRIRATPEKSMRKNGIAFAVFKHLVSGIAFGMIT